jgi:hypothetical protein
MAQKLSHSLQASPAQTQSVTHSMGSKLFFKLDQGFRYRSTPGFILLPLSGAPEYLWV